MATVNRTQLVKAIATRVGLTQREVAAVLDALVDMIVDTVAKGGVVNIHRLGRFVRRQLAPRKVRVPRTNRVVEVKGYVPKFRPAKAFKEAVR